MSTISHTLLVEPHNSKSTSKHIVYYQTRKKFFYLLYLYLRKRVDES